MGTTTCQPMDGATPGGPPNFSAQNERQGFAALMGGGSGRQLGARPGFRPGTPGNLITVTSTTWTAGTEFAAVLDPAYSTTQGPYRYAYVPLPSADSGSITPADGTYPRKDIIVIRVDDASAGDSSGARQAPLVYRAGAATSMTPTAPTLNAREFLVGTITVPQVGGGSPTFTINPAVFVTSGSPQPVFSQTERDALTKYDGLQVIRMDVAGRPTETCDGTLWYPQGSGASLELARTATANTANTLWGPGVPSELAAAVQAAPASCNPSLFSFPSNNQIAVVQAGRYSAGWAITDFATVPPGGGASGFLTIRNVTTGQAIASNQYSATGDTFAGRPSIYLPAGTILQFNFQTTTSVTCKHLIDIARLG